jgi:hypothetical protein
MKTITMWRTHGGFAVRVFGFRVNVTRSISADMYRTVQYRVSYRPGRTGTKRGITFGIMRSVPYNPPVPYRRPTCFACGAWAGTCGHTTAYAAMNAEWNRMDAERVTGCGPDCSGCDVCAAPIRNA